ncbi:beta-propeller fold lactonase family protein, partial [Salmonella enterica]|uniref:beta-propeller fold lactonase family protein n=1 Tax=Salmonella enterica TaxID=28901 RepID=UPI00398C6A0E
TDQVKPLEGRPVVRYRTVRVGAGVWGLTYRIAPDCGGLSFAPASVRAGSPTHISSTEHGRFVFVGSYNAHNVTVTRLQEGLQSERSEVGSGLAGCPPATSPPGYRNPWVPRYTKVRIS